MADEPEEIEVLEPVVEAEPDVPAVIEPEEGIADLKSKLTEQAAQIEAERQARADAEKRARDAIQKQYAAQNEAEDTNLALVKSAIDTVKGNSASLRAQYSNAMAVGDYDKAAEVQEAMSMNAARLMELERGKMHMESRPKAAPPVHAPSDPVESFAVQLSPRSADWVRKNPQYVTDPRLNRKMLAAHEMAVADGIPVDTPEYFSTIEDTLKIRRAAPEPVVDDALSEAAAPTQRRAPPTAPVTRSGNPSNPRPNVVRLTKEQLEAAEISGLTPQEYAKQLQRGA